MTQETQELCPDVRRCAPPAKVGQGCGWGTPAQPTNLPTQLTHHLLTGQTRKQTAKVSKDCNMMLQGIVVSLFIHRASS